MQVNKSRLIKLMRQERLNQSALAGRLGVSRQTVYRVLHNKRRVGPKFLTRLAREFPAHWQEVLRIR